MTLLVGRININMENGVRNVVRMANQKIQTHHLSINLNGTPLLFY
jgi:hypothetical protein